MKNNHNRNNSSVNGFIPNSLRFISSCIKTASSGVRSATASVAASISGDPNALKDQVLYSCFERLELGPSSFRRVLLLGYSNGFQVLDVEDASNVGELVSKRDDPVTFLQMQPQPEKVMGYEGYRSSHPLLLVVACEEANKVSGMIPNGRDGLVRNGHTDHQAGSVIYSPTAVRFYSLRSHNYVHVLRFRSPVYIVRCSPRVVAVCLASQIYCFDSVTLENKFSVLTYPIPQLGVQGTNVNIGYGPMAVGSRWLAYASNNPLQSNSGRLSPQSLTPPGVSPSTSPSNGILVARYAKESSKQLAAGLLNLGDKSYKTLSKYYQDLVPDVSSSPIPSNCSWKVNRGTESDSAGMVVVQDFVSKAVVSQFRAHTSPISALCFDPSGTLLVTASVHGNNINIFRIMPFCSNTGSGNQSYDWSSSHVHLYKLHRGMTSAVIQDICFSQYSQWVSIVTSRGTCHIFVLSPFGGEAVLQIQNSHSDGPILLPIISLPWWSTSSFTVNQHSSTLPPPPPVTLSVVSRVKNNNSGWINTVSNAASSAAGKVLLPSGALTAIFHSCIPHDLQPGHAKANSVEHLMAYSPSGHVIQYCLLPSVGGESSDTVSRTGSGSTQEDELRVKIEPLQWWDVCRRTDWPEREEHVSGISPRKQKVSGMVVETSDFGDNDNKDKESVRSHEKSHLYLSNAEVQINSGRIPIWQKSQIYSFTMSPVMGVEDIRSEDPYCREIEIEKIPVHEVDIKQKDLLPVFDHFHRMQSNWGDRSFVGSHSSVGSLKTNEKFSENTVISHAKFVANASSDSSEHSDGGSPEDSYPLITKSYNENKEQNGGKAISASHVHNNNQISANKEAVSISSRQPISDTSNVKNNLSNGLPSDRTIAKGSQSANRNEPVEGVSNGSSNRSDLSMNSLDEGPSHDSLDFEQFFQEGYCKADVKNDCSESTEVVTDVDSNNSPCDGEKCEEDGDNDDLLGGVFAFSEEG